MSGDQENGGGNGAGVDTRFKKGCPSPNPKGRPRKDKSSDTGKTLAETMTVIVDYNGRKSKVSLADANILKLAQNGLGGDTRASESMFRAMKRSEEIKDKRAKRAAASPAAAPPPPNLPSIYYMNILEKLGFLKYGKDGFPVVTTEAFRSYLRRNPRLELSDEEFDDFMIGLEDFGELLQYKAEQKTYLRDLQEESAARQQSEEAHWSVYTDVTQAIDRGEYSEQTEESKADARNFKY